uniref:Uncharacterized protein n=1 Tax=Arundo donax TaxID=35708 RepID=A0A0A9FWE5_ARUDO
MFRITFTDIDVFFYLEYSQIMNLYYYYNLYLLLK